MSTRVTSRPGMDRAGSPRYTRLMDQQSTNVWVMLYPAHDVAGWIGHCLDLDLVNQGRTLTEAFEGVSESIATAAECAIREGTSVLQMYRPAPEEDWEHFRRLQQVGELHVPSLEASARGCHVAAHVRIVVTVADGTTLIQVPEPTTA
ncbi:MAG: hypothetical protein H6736_23200 [Alphaproteobacteria bacterium]|nr:hypothetical protein [Alphaproteobacteria bacterium]MCB9694729.1 hypothetical protein [Alphaproteobacteria bacterium]